MMRAIHNKIPTDDAVKRFGIYLPSVCNCCNIRKMETTGHLFSESQISSQLWNFFCIFCGIKQVHGQLRMSTMHWWISFLIAYYSAFQFLYVGKYGKIDVRPYLIRKGC